MTSPLPLVLLPGLHGTTELLRPLIARLSANRQVLAIDYPSDAALDFPGYVEFVRARLPERPCAILGESFSGPIAIAIAARVPSVAGLILASTFARFPMPRVLAPAVARIARSKISPRRSALFLAGQRATPELIDELTRTIAALRPDLVADRVRLALAVDVRSMLAQTEFPLLCLTGRRDRLTGRRSLSTITAARPDAEVVHIDAGHVMLETHPDAAAEKIARFLRRIDGDPG